MGWTRSQVHHKSPAELQYELVAIWALTHPGTAHNALTSIQVNRYTVLYPIVYIKMSTISDYWSWTTGFSSQ